MEDDLTPIYEIQGEQHTSPLDGQSVTTEGIVTAVDTNGFYVQDATGDGNIATSDALFVFTGSAPTVAVGDEVEIEGTVSEFTPGGVETRNLSTTQLSNVNVTIRSSGNTLPTAVLLGAGGRLPPTENIDDDAFGAFEPTTDGIDFFESLEGMRVTVENAVAVSGTNRFGEIFTVVDRGDGATGLSTRGTLNISPDDFNPEKIQIDEDSGIFDFDFPDVNVGDVLGDVTGVVGYSFGNFEVYPTEDFTGNIESAGLQAETTNLVGTADQVTIASYNVLNLDPNSGDGDDDEGDGRFAAIAEQIVNNLQSPDIIGLQEIQDNTGSESDDGVTTADETLQKLVDAIAAAGGPTYSFVDNTFIGENTSGGQPGGNIRTAFLYNPDRVTLDPDSVQTIGGQGEGEAFEGARLPLVADFEFGGETITVVNNHFSSKGGSAPILGVEQPFEARQEEVDVNGSLDERQAQSQAVRDFVDGVANADANANLVVLGDLNEFEFVSPVEDFVTQSGFTNLTDTLPENERYTFNFQGNSQSLDHILVNGRLTDVAEFDIVYTNSEFAATSDRASDHDPLLVRLDITALTTDPGPTPGRDVILGTPERDVINALAGNDLVRGLGGNDRLAGAEGNDRLFGGDGNDGMFGGSGNDTLFGNTGDDALRGQVGDDRLSGANGNDRLLGAAGSDSLFGGAGNDRLLGGGGNDVLRGNDGDDRLAGNAGNDRLLGGAGNDRLLGGPGNDRLRGGLGNDVIRMGPGRDIVELGQQDGLDRVIDFDNVDRVALLGSLSSNDLTLVQQGNDVVMQVGSDRLARFIGITVNFLEARII
ncbi:MAG: endonuclease/exonuclease/phosphatase family protein [Cyanobacteria bacterium J06638_20]